jgi:hypothetical protein
MTARVMNNYLIDKLNLGIGLQGFNYFTQDRLAKMVAELQSFRPGKQILTLVISINVTKIITNASIDRNSKFSYF